MMTKVRKGYKETEIGVIPEDWEIAKLSQIVQNRSEKYTPNEDESFPYIALEHIDQESGRLLGIGNSSESTSTKSAFYKNDVLFGKLRPYLRKYWLSNIDGVCSTEILALKPLCNSEYAFYTIQTNRFIEDVSKKAFGTKMPRTSWIDIRDYQFPLPPLPEQERIAEILSTTDGHIEKLDKTIEDYQLLKKGMMKKLLTEGIGHTEFKETEIGRIPKDWEVKTLGNLTTITKLAGFEFTKYIEYDDQGEIIALRALNVKNMKLNLNEIKRISKESSDGLTRSKLYKNDLLFTYVGTIGEVALIDEDDKYHLAPNVAKITVEREVTSEYILQYLTSIIAKREIKMRLTTTSQPALSMGNLREVEVIVPPLPEQQQIAEILSNLDNRIELFTKEKQDFIQLKKALMEQLLTGKIRTV